MKPWAVLAIALLPASVSWAQGPGLLVPPGLGLPQARPASVMTDEQRILHEKTAELHKLQDEILKLGGTISSPKKVRITLRIVGIDAEKLKQHKLSDPLHFNLKSRGPSGGIVPFESDKELLQVLEPLVTSGCAEIVFSPTVVSSMGETTVLNCFRELPYTEEAIAANKQAELSSDSGKVPGMGIQLLASDDPGSDMLRVVTGLRLTEDDPWTAITVDGRIQPGTSSRRLQSVINLKSGATIVLGGPMETNLLTKWGIRQVASTSPPPNLDEEQMESSREVRFYVLITAERLPVDRNDSGTKQ